MALTFCSTLFTVLEFISIVARVDMFSLEMKVEAFFTNSNHTGKWLGHL